MSPKDPALEVSFLKFQHIPVLEPASPALRSAAFPFSVCSSSSKSIKSNNQSFKNKNCKFIRMISLLKLLDRHVWDLSSPLTDLILILYTSDDVCMGLVLLQNGVSPFHKFLPLLPHVCCFACTGWIWEPYYAKNKRRSSRLYVG